MEIGHDGLKGLRTVGEMEIIILDSVSRIYCMWIYCLLQIVVCQDC
jgi:hypothetical protein